MGTFPPSPDTELLSAEEAKARLREIVEGFFFRRLTTEDGKAIRPIGRQKSAWAARNEAP